MLENAQYKLLEISILVKIFEKILFLAKVPKILNFQIFGNSLYIYFHIIPNLVKIMVNPDFFFNWRKITIFLKFYEKS